MNAILSQNNYGKSNVRVLKVKRDTSIHEITEFSVNVQFEGNFDEVHVEGNNRKVLPTDTIKNTIYALAKDPINSIEEFGLCLAKYFISNNEQVSKVKIEIIEGLWNRILIEDKSTKVFKPHNHSFESAGNEKRTAGIEMLRTGQKISSGIKDLLILKTTNSGFENYIIDKFTTLKETSDRVFATSVKANWLYSNEVSDFNKVYDNVRQVILETFANHHSLSVQHTIYEIGKTIIETCKEISEISLSMPNKHYLLFNLNQFGLENNNEIFIPTDEPFGLIEATIKREN